ncbi:Lar family restriction alleviation protein [Sphingomonas naphthae]|uniref:Lar family restriction alleviation protein n=1 Tax=Sphingomonas naphthae TaxID=1813468 RepID=A0ABY7TL49_9SPHN|nr:Lar family restriction alleviation protein [Sphingomonas naphthae]WCT73966.1 Lar family restriction alleviation protein [Sphingomonas naphthae]
MTNPTQEAVALLPCPFCGGEASADGRTQYSKPLTDTWWEDGSPITEAFSVNCIKCGASANSGLVNGYQTKGKAIAAWNTRALVGGFPDIGPDPFKVSDRAGADERLKRSYVIQQKGVPDQTALVWRYDLMQQHYELIRLRSIVADDEASAADRELRAALERIAKIVETYLYIQSDKLEDIPNIARAALALASSAGGGDDDVRPRVAEVVAEYSGDGGGFWKSCSGCHETEDGYDVGHYPFSEAFGCKLGGGCSECGGIGATWDTTNYTEMANSMERYDVLEKRAEAGGAGADAAAREYLSSLDWLPDYVKTWLTTPTPAPEVGEVVGLSQHMTIGLYHQPDGNWAGQCRCGRGFYASTYDDACKDWASHAIAALPTPPAKGDDHGL